MTTIKSPTISGKGPRRKNELSIEVDYERASVRDDVMVHDNSPELVDDDTTPVSNAGLETGVNDNNGDDLPDITDHVSLEPDVNINSLHDGDALADDGRNVDGTQNGNTEDQDGSIEPGANGLTNAEDADEDMKLGATGVDDNIPDRQMNDKKERADDPDQPRDSNRRSTRTITKPCRLNISQTSGKTYQNGAHQHM